MPTPNNAAPAVVIPLESAPMSVAAHFTGKDPTVRATYQRLIDIARTLGPVTEEAKKTSIHLVRHTGYRAAANAIVRTKPAKMSRGSCPCLPVSVSASTKSPR